MAPGGSGLDRRSRDLLGHLIQEVLQRRLCVAAQHRLLLPQLLDEAPREAHREGPHALLQHIGGERHARVRVDQR
eukprot:10612480-Alexandrium_andersonii.AAC.1